jgi:hypothetical protein
MGFSGCGPTIAALLPKMGFGGCVTHIAELLPKMGFSGLSPWLHLDLQRWDSLVVFYICSTIAKDGILWLCSTFAALLPKMGFFSFVHIEALLPKMMGYSLSM